jgi:hypothetical protein
MVLLRGSAEADCRIVRFGRVITRGRILTPYVMLIFLGAVIFGFLYSLLVL